MFGSAENIFRTNVYDRNVEIYDQDVSQIGKAQRFPSSSPAMLHRIPNAATKSPIQRTILIQILSLRIRFAAISEKLIIPSRQVNANKQKQNVTRKVTIPFIAVPGVRTAMDSVYLGSLSRACQVIRTDVIANFPRFSNSTPKIIKNELWR